MSTQFTFTHALQRSKPVATAVLMHPLAKPVLGTALMAPAGYLLWAAVNDALGANPAEALIRQSGEMALRCLLLTLAVTPLREWTGWPALARFRRLLGLLTFTWGVLHLASYSWLDMGLVVEDIVRDIIKRPFILVGSLTLLLMVPLAATSMNRVIKAMGAVRWKRLHRLVYAIGVLAILHFLWMRSGKGVYGAVMVYGGILGLLLGWRARDWLVRGWRVLSPDRP